MLKLYKHEDGSLLQYLNLFIYVVIISENLNLCYFHSIWGTEKFSIDGSIEHFMHVA